jgi:hypothetical protein
MTLHPRPTIAGFLVTLVVMVCAVPAQATVIDHDHYSFSESFPDVICGVSVRHDFVVSGVAHVRVGKGELDTLFFGIDNYQATDTLTNEANGNFVLIEHNAVGHDIKGTHVEGSIFEATTIVSGQPIRIRDMTGRIVSRDRGVIRETYLFDTLGDHTPGGLFLETLSVQLSGQHPLFPFPFFDEDAFCAIVRPLLLG